MSVHGAAKAGLRAFTNTWIPSAPISVREIETKLDGRRAIEAPGGLDFPDTSPALRNAETTVLALKALL